MNWHDYFIHDNEAGILIWKERPLEMSKNLRAHMTWNALYAGKRAGHTQHEGAGASVYVRVHNKMYRAHRIVYEMYNPPLTGAELVDHVNGDYEDNRKENLRLSDSSENGMNRGKNKNNTSGVKGVMFDKSRGKYTAVIVTRGKSKRVGRYKTKGLAAVAYAKASLRLHGKFSPFYRKQAALNAIAGTNS